MCASSYTLRILRRYRDLTKRGHTLSHCTHTHVCILLYLFVRHRLGVRPHPCHPSVPTHTPLIPSHAHTRVYIPLHTLENLWSHQDLTKRQHMFFHSTCTHHACVYLISNYSVRRKSLDRTWRAESTTTSASSALVTPPQNWGILKYNNDQRHPRTISNKNLPKRCCPTR